MQKPEKSMKYFKCLYSGKIANSIVMVSFWHIGGYYDLAHRDLSPSGTNVALSKITGQYPRASEYGDYVEIDEQEALALDPDLFCEAFEDYEAYKVWLQGLQPYQEGATVQQAMLSV